MPVSEKPTRARLGPGTLISLAFVTIVWVWVGENDWS
jgi:hypothetical protein